MALEQLDEANQFTLAALLDHLRLVVDHSSHNKMTAENISSKCDVLAIDISAEYFFKAVLL